MKNIGLYMCFLTLLLTFQSLAQNVSYDGGKETLVKIKTIHYPADSIGNLFYNDYLSVQERLKELPKTAVIPQSSTNSRLKDSLIAVSSNFGDSAKNMNDDISTHFQEKIYSDTVNSLPFTQNTQGKISSGLVGKKNAVKIDSAQFSSILHKNSGGLDAPELKIDSATIKEESTQIVTNQLTENTGIDPSLFPTDSASVAQNIELIQQNAEESLKETKAYKQLEDELMGNASEESGSQHFLDKNSTELLNEDAANQIKEQKAAEAKEFLSKYAEQVEEAQSDIASLKKKYKEVPSTNDLTQAVKINSLNDQPLFTRLIVGLNVKIDNSNPLQLDIAPFITYKLTSNFEIGSSLIYRTAYFSRLQGHSVSESNIYGYSIFTNLVIWKGFLLSAESEFLSIKDTSQEESREWDNTLLLGIGKRFSLTKWLEMQTTVSYNALNKQNSWIHSSPIIIKTAIRLKLDRL